ncbi:MAG: DUF3467 domain-containing protein [Terracidiphilus sp.]
MPTENQVAAPIAQRIEWLVDQDQFPSFYSNITSVGITPFDISVICGEVESATPSAVKAKPRVKITLSPEQASLLMQMLQQALRKFVEGSGPLRPNGGQVLDLENFKFENK